MSSDPEPDTSERLKWMGVRSLFECPILDEHKWGKLPEIPADAVFVDLEDSVPPDLKEEARERLLAYLAMPGYFGSAVVIPRVNHLDTPWGRDDVEALVGIGWDTFSYPKVESPDDLAAVVEICSHQGVTPHIRVGIESPAGVTKVEQIVSTPEVIAASCGIADLHLLTGQPLYDETGHVSWVHSYAKLRTVMACAAVGKARMGFVPIRDLRDLETYRTGARRERELGFTGCATFYPAHVPVLNEIFSTSDEERERAVRIVEAYEGALTAGSAATTLDGEALVIHDYKWALRILDTQ
jgi:citrate lyase beta subunit